MDQLVTQADIARHFAVTREAVRKWSLKDDFPERAGERTYRLADVVAWREDKLTSSQK